MAGNCVVILFDAEGRVRSATSGAGTLLGTMQPKTGATIDDTFAATPEIREWVKVAADRARSTDSGDSCVKYGEDEAPVEFSLAPLAGDGFALVASPAEHPRTDAEPVSQQAWHDLKNQLGGLKLYATYLKMKLGEQDDQIRETSEKIVGAIDAIVRAIVEIRRGEDQTKGE